MDLNGAVSLIPLTSYKLVWAREVITQGRSGGVVEYQYTRKKIDKIPQNTPNSSKYTQK